MRAAQQGDRKAVEALYSEYRGRIVFFVRKNIPWDDAVEDIVADTFAAAIEKLPSLRNAEAFGSWLYSIAYHSCISYRESEAGLARFGNDLELESTMENAALAEPVELPSDYIENEETIGALREAVNGLRAEQRAAVIMYYFEELSVAEVGEALGISENAAKQLLFRARKKLASRLKGLGGGKTLCMVPLGAVLCAVMNSKSAALGTAAVKSGIAVKAAIVGIAAAAAVGTPVALSRMGGHGEYRPPDDEQVTEDNTENEPAFEEKEDLDYAMLLETDAASVDCVIVTDTAGSPSVKPAEERKAR